MLCQISKQPFKPVLFFPNLNQGKKKYELKLIYDEVFVNDPYLNVSD